MVRLTPNLDLIRMYARIRSNAVVMILWSIASKPFR